MAGSGVVARIRGADPTRAAALLAGLAAVAVIRTTVLPGVANWDTAEAQAVPPLMGTMHPTGFPAFVVLGWLVSIGLQPLGAPAYLMNLMSALLVGAAAGGTVLVSRRLGAPLAVAVAIAAGFALTPIVWSIGTVADVHALHLALVVVLVLALLRWEALVAAVRERPGEAQLGRRADRALMIAAGVFGVAVANHALTLLLVPAVGLYVLAVDRRVLGRPRLVAAAIGTSLGVAALLYLELPLRAGLLRAPLVYGHPETFIGFWQVVLAGQFQGSISGPFSDLGGKAAALVDLAVTEFGPLAGLIPVALAVTIVRLPCYALLSVAAAFVTCLFAASYENALIDRYYLGPAFFAWTWIAVLAGTVADWLTRSRRPGGRARGVPETGSPAAREPEPEPGYVAPWPGPRTVLAVALGAALLVPTGLVLPARWRALDRSRDTSGSAWLDDAFAALAPDAVVVSWWSYSTPMWYGQLVERRRPDVWIVDDRTLLDQGLGTVSDVIDATLGRRPVYVIRVTESDIHDLAQRYTIEPVGRPDNLYRVTGRQEATP